jgi:hypothetical protein
VSLYKPTFNPSSPLPEIPTYIKVHRKHLSEQTLEEYGLPWEYDKRDKRREYLIIKQWLSERDQEILFKHTLTLREYDEEDADRWWKEGEERVMRGNRKGKANVGW